MTWRERFDQEFNGDDYHVSGKDKWINFMQTELATLFSRIEEELKDETLPTYGELGTRKVSAIEDVIARNALRSRLRQTLSTLRSEYGVKEEA